MTAEEYFENLNEDSIIFDINDDCEFTKDQLILFAERYHKSKMPTREIIKQAFNAGRESSSIYPESDEYFLIYKNFEDYENEILDNGSC